ncbi:hypothetical protein CDIK_4106 [Cucumispora dikerogammari]|nr:hypothetical protein CDIK_4106 [Cucumispora dikerogammari]
MFLEEGSIRYVDSLQKIVFQYNTCKHKATKVSPFVLFRGYDSLSLNWGDINQHFEIQQLRDQYIRYIEGYRAEYNIRVAAENVNVDDFVIIAKEFDGYFSKRRRALESYYMDGVYKAITVYTTYVAVVKIEEGVPTSFPVHKKLIKKVKT